VAPSPWSDTSQTTVRHWSDQRKVYDFVTIVRHLVVRPAGAVVFRHRGWMAPPRIEIVGHTYHVNNSAVSGAKLFRDDDDRWLYHRLLGLEARRSDWCVLAYTLMTTHLHVVLRLRKPSLSSGVQRLHGTYARAYNRRHARRGALWQCRFYDSLTATEGHLYESIRYVARNAPRAGMCDRAEDWPWCSYGAAIGTAPRDPIVDEEALLALFGTSPEEARATLRAYVEEDDPRQRLGQTGVRLRSDH
jgi:REP element-mobilizing transposase RayT